MLLPKALVKVTKLLFTYKNKGGLAMHCTVEIIEEIDGEPTKAIITNFYGFEVTCEYTKEQLYKILLSECVEHSMRSEYSPI